MILDSTYPDDARVTNECTELLKNKHEIHLFCLCFKKPFVKNEVINQINVHRYHCSKLTYKLSALANDIGLYGFILKNKIIFVVIQFFVRVFQNQTQGGGCVGISVNNYADFL